MLDSKPKKLSPLPPPITRDSLLWLFAIQVVVLVPHFLEVPPWIPLVWAAVVFWRWKIFQGAWNYPNKLHKTLVVFICTAGLVLSVGANFNLISMLSLLLVGSILKLLEIKNRKDFVLLIFLSLFILAAQFIFFNHFLAAFYGVFCLLLACAALMQLYRILPAKTLWQQLRPCLLMLLQALPVMAMMFMLMPRLGSFWTVPGPQQAKTGMSDSMSPGDISQLVQSNELAFRVILSGAGLAGAGLAGEPLPQEVLYWRSLVLSRFDGRRWSQGRPSRSEAQPATQAISGWREKIHYLGDSLSYEIIAEPSNSTWLYSLAVPRQWSHGLLLGRELNLQAELPVNQRLSYKVTSVLNYNDVEAQTDEVLQNNLKLPQQSNPETLRIAQEWFAEVGTSEKLIEKLFSYYRSNFFYTLAPPALGKDSVDEFLWKGRQGFCEHFASSFVFFMRAAGVPARVVVGYQGGELNPAENYWSVYQRDAHAWAEVWIEGRGWLRYDPTAAVAPERIRRGISESLSATDRAFLGQSYAASLPIFNNIRQRWDALNFQWVRWVMNYDSGLQSQLLQGISSWRLVVIVLGTGLLSALLTLALLFFRTRRKPLASEKRAAQSIYRQLCRKLQPFGFVPQVGEAPGDFAARVINARPDLQQKLSLIVRLYEQLVYAENTAVLPDLKRYTAQFSARNRLHRIPRSR